MARLHRTGGAVDPFNVLDECVARLHARALAWAGWPEPDLRMPRQDATLAAAAHERENLRIPRWRRRKLRIKSGHAHRPWELRGRGRAEEMLAKDDVEAEHEAGRAADFDALVARATSLLERAQVRRQPSRDVRGRASGGYSAVLIVTS